MCLPATKPVATHKVEIRGDEIYLFPGVPERRMTTLIATPECREVLVRMGLVVHNGRGPTQVSTAAYNFI